MKVISLLASFLLVQGVASAQIRITKPLKEVDVVGLPCDIRLSGDGTRLAVVTDKGNGYLYSFPDCKLLMEVKTNGPDGRVVLSHDGKWFAVVSRNESSFYLFDATTQKKVHTVKNYLGLGGTLRFNEAGSLLYLVQREREQPPGGYAAKEPGVYAYDLDKKTRTYRFGASRLGTSTVLDFAIDDVRKRVYFFELENQSAGQAAPGGGIQTYSWANRQFVSEDLKTKKRVTRTIELSSTKREIQLDDRMALSPDRSRLLFGHKLINLDDNSETEAFRSGRYGGVSFTPDSKFLACCARPDAASSGGSTVAIHPVGTFEASFIFSPQAKKDEAYSNIPPAISPDGQYMCAPGPGASFLIWDFRRVSKK